MTGDPTAINLDDHANSQDPLVRRMFGHAFHGDIPFDVPFISHIAGNLYSGGCMNGLILPRSIRHVVSLYPWEQYTAHHELDSSLTVKQYDSRSEVDEAAIDAIVTWAARCVDDAPTLIHCQAGLNRSGLVAALVLYRNCFTATTDEAIDLLRQRRSPAVLCNPTFERAVLEWN